MGYGSFLDSPLGQVALRRINPQLPEGLLQELVALHLDYNIQQTLGLDSGVARYAEQVEQSRDVGFHIG